MCGGGGGDSSDAHWKRDNFQFGRRTFGSYARFGRPPARPFPVVMAKERRRRVFVAAAAAAALRLDEARERASKSGKASKVGGRSSARLGLNCNSNFWAQI